jgi:hypothetical protein
MPRTLILALFALAACSGGALLLPDPDPSLAPGEPLALTRVAGAPRFQSGMTSRGRIVVESPEAWEAAWARLHEGASGYSPPPAVDFSREVVIVAAMGARSSGGYVIEVAGAVRRSDHVRVRVVETSPARSCAVTSALTQPVDVVRMRRVALPLRFEEERTVRTC